MVTSLNSMSTLPYDHPLYEGVVGEYGADGANRLITEADAVLVVGSSLGSMTTHSWTLIAAGAQRAPTDRKIGRTYPVEVALVGDVRGDGAACRGGRVPRAAGLA